jgi:hypothetical protein
VQRELNKRQIAVLPWARQGCPSAVWETSAYKISCVALQNRGIPRISKRRGQWNATLTESGRHYPTHIPIGAASPLRNQENTRGWECGSCQARNP